MELLQLEYFYKIAHSESLVQAAKELHVSQPALSKMLRHLESELSVSLFNRQGRRLVLNETGEIFLQHTAEILDSIETLKGKISDIRQRNDLHLKVGVYAASKLIPSILKDFKELYPNVQISMIQHKSMDKNSSSFDLIMTSSTEILDDANSVLLTEENILLAVPHQHPLAAYDNIPLSMLKDEKIIGLTRGKALRDTMDEYCKGVGFEPNVVLEMDDPGTLRSLIRAELGVAFFPEKSWKDMLDNSVKFVNLHSPTCVRYLYLTWPKNAFLNTSAKIFRGFVRDFFNGL